MSSTARRVQTPETRHAGIWYMHPPGVRQGHGERSALYIDSAFCCWHCCCRVAVVLRVLWPVCAVRRARGERRVLAQGIRGGADKSGHTPLPSLYGIASSAVRGIQSMHSLFGFSVLYFLRWPFYALRPVTLCNTRAGTAPTGCGRVAGPPGLRRVHPWAGYIKPYSRTLPSDQRTDTNGEAPARVWLNLSPSHDFAQKNTAHAWTDGPPPPPSRYNRARCALLDSEGFSRIGRSSREQRVL